MDDERRTRLLFENIEEKIDFEFEKFFKAILRTSKSNIFAQSREIEIKKQITKHLRSSVRGLDPEIVNRIFSHVNLLEECYRYHMDHPSGDIGEQIDTYISKQ